MYDNLIKKLIKGFEDIVENISWKTEETKRKIGRIGKISSPGINI